MKLQQQQYVVVLLCLFPIGALLDLLGGGQAGVGWVCSLLGRIYNNVYYGVCVFSSINI